MYYTGHHSGRHIYFLVHDCARNNITYYILISIIFLVRFSKIRNTMKLISKDFLNVFLCFVSLHLRTCNMGNSLSARLVDKRRRQLAVRFYSKRYIIRLGVGALAGGTSSTLNSGVSVSIFDKTRR